MLVKGKLQENLAEIGRKILWENLAGKSCREILWVICKNQSRIGFRNAFLTFTSEN